MSQVLLIGSHTLTSIITFLDRELTITPAWWAGTLDAEEADTLNYANTREVLASLVPRLANGQLASVQMRREEPRFLVGLYRPNFCGEPLTLWTCVLEGRQEEIGLLYDRVTDVDGLAFAALSLDEAVELSSEDVSIETFPWEAWQLIRARVRTPTAQWTERAGPAA
jgi:hypothetical protein